MLLRASGEQTEGKINFDAVMDGAQRAGIRWDRELNALVEALIAHDPEALHAACALAERAMGADAVRDALTVASAFNGITRVADATGIPLDENTASVTTDLRAAIGIDSFDYSAKSARYA